MNDLVSEEALPDWLRQASADSAQPTQRQPVPGAAAGGAPQGYPPAAQSAYPPAYPPAYAAASQQPAPGYGGGLVPIAADEPPPVRPDANAFPSIENAGNYQPPLAGGGGMSASSLLDPNALPSWLSGQQGQAAPDNMRSGDGMRAQSLVDETALPGWLRTEPESPAPASPAQGSFAPPAVPGWEGYSASPAAPSASAFPPAGYAGTQMQPPAPGPVPMSPMSQMAAPAPANGQQGFSANQLIDSNALPDWLVQGQDGSAGMAQSAGVGMQQPGAGAAHAPWSASDLIDPAMLPGWVRDNEQGMPQAGAAQPPQSGMSPMPSGSAFDAPRDRTGRVPAPREMNPAEGINTARQSAADRDFDYSYAGTGQQGALSRKQPAMPLDNHEMPAWLRDESANGYGQAGVPASPSGRQQRGGANPNGYGGYDGQNGYDGYNGYNGYDGYDGQNGQPEQQRPPRGQRGRMPAGQTGQSWAAPDDSSPWARRPSTRHAAKPANPPEKKRRGGIFGFFRRG